MFATGLMLGMMPGAQVSVLLRLMLYSSDLRCLTRRSRMATWMFRNMYLLGFCLMSVSPLSNISCRSCCFISLLRLSFRHLHA